MYWLIAYLGILASIILGGILGLLVSFLGLAAVRGRISVVHLVVGIALGAFIGGVLAVIRVRRYLRERRERELAKNLVSLPENASYLIKAIIRKMHYRKNVRDDVMAELAAHFEDELKDCKTDEEKEQKAQQLIAEFGDVKLLAVLLRRAKKRCRPLWRTVIARTFQTIGLLILCFIVYLAWFLTGKPIVTVDYVAELNRIVRPVADETLNAAPLYHKAAELVEEQPDDIKELSGKRYNEVTDEQKQLIEKWLSDNEEIFELVIAGAKKPYYWPKYEAENNQVMAVLLPALAKFRRLAYSLRWKAQLRAEQGKYEDAFADMKACYRFGQHLRGDKSLVEQLVGIAIEAVAVQTIRDILSKYQIDSATLAKLQNDFEKMIVGEDFAVSLKFEKLAKYDEIQRCFTEDDFGGGHLYLPRVIALSKPYHYEQDEKILKLVLSPEQWAYVAKALFMHPNKQETREMIDRFCAFWEQIAGKSPAQLRSENIEVGRQAMELIKGNILLEMLAPAYSRVIEISYRLPADVGSTLTIIALLRYKQDIGSYPENLNEMVTAGYLKRLAMDPYTDKPLVYKKTDDNFTLYSVGLNFTDDGGEVFRDEKGRVRKWADEGDWIFWPIQGN